LHLNSLSRDCASEISALLSCAGHRLAKVIGDQFGAFASVVNFDHVQVHRIGEIGLARWPLDVGAWSD
jgi:hypothetical protein